MLGLMFILVYGTCLLVIPAVLGIAVWRWAIKRGKARAWSWGVAAALAIPVWAFWDYYPTKWTHEYYCEKEAGFWIYKTLDQWKAENPGVAETLVEYSVWKEERGQDGTVAHINQRFSMVYINHLTSINEREIFAHVWRWEQKLIDSKTNEVMAKSIDFSTGNGFIGGKPSLRFWLQNDHCVGYREQSNKFGKFLEKFKGKK